jgi:hypothetical protein
MKYRCKKHGEHPHGVKIVNQDNDDVLVLCLLCVRDLFAQHGLNQVEAIDDEAMYLVIQQAPPEPAYPPFRRPQDADDD